MTSITAVEMRIRRALLEHADAADLDVTYRQVLRMAKIAARAAKEPRPKDAEGSGRRALQKPPERPSGRRNPLRGSTATSESATGAPGAVSAIRGAA